MILSCGLTLYLIPMISAFGPWNAARKQTKNKKGMVNSYDQALQGFPAFLKPLLPKKPPHLSCKIHVYAKVNAEEQIG